MCSLAPTGYTDSEFCMIRSKHQVSKGLVSITLIQPSRLSSLLYYGPVVHAILFLNVCIVHLLAFSRYLEDIGSCVALSAPKKASYLKVMVVELVQLKRVEMTRLLKTTTFAYRFAEFLGTLLFQYLVGFSKGDALAAGMSYAVLGKCLSTSQQFPT